MASIDAFLTLAELPNQATSAPRASLRRVRAHWPAANGSRAPDSDRVIASVVGIALVAAVFFALHAAMLGGNIETFVTDTPLLISILHPPKPALLPPPPLAPRSAATQPHTAAHDRALQAVVLARDPSLLNATHRPANAAHAQEQPLALFAPDGSVQLPPPPLAAPKRDLLAYRAVQRFLPHGYVGNRAAMAMDTRSQARKAAQIIASFTGGSGDPCADLEQEMVNLSDRSRAEAAADRYAQSCEGH